MNSPFRFHGAIDRVHYLIASIALLVLQYLALALPYITRTGPALGYWPLGFRLPLSQVLLGYSYVSGQRTDRWPLVAGFAVCILVSWLLLALAVRRAKSAQRSLWGASLVIVPIVQIPTIIWLACLPSVGERQASPAQSPVSIRVALKGVVTGSLLTLALVLLSTLIFHAYGFGLFIASPFIVGCVTAYLGNRPADIGSGSTARLVLGACFLGGVALMAVAVEGLICLVMAAPLIAAMAWLGGLVGRAIALKKPAGTPGRTAASIVALPLLFAIDQIAPPNASFESIESIEVSASDHAVWDAVVHMGPIPAPPIAPFRWGLAYPMSGTIRGSGIGAIREGVFSTGVAYERVTEWEPDKRLSFIVLSDPPTMRELSPYSNVHAPHLNGYFRTLDARFTITPLANGRTQLSLATRHELSLSPALYWLPMAKWAVHANKTRVLAHFARQAEAAAAQ